MIDELEGEFFTINDEDQEWLYNTICYGWLYDYNNNKDRYFLKILVTDESEQTIWFENVYENRFEDEEFDEVDKTFYPRSDRAMIYRVFEFRWE